MDPKDLVYELTPNEFKKCAEFALEAPKTHSLKDHRGNEIRDKRTLQIHVLTGKIGEVAFAHLAKPFLQIEADLVHKKKNEGDKADFFINDKAIEIKTIKHKAKFLLIEPKNIHYKLKNGFQLPFINILMINLWNYDTKKPSRKIAFGGFAFDYDLFDEKICIINKKGELIPNTNEPLKATNFSIHRNDLRKNFLQLMEILKGGFTH